MTDVHPHWETRISDLWAVIGDYDEPEFLSLVDELVAELPAGNAFGQFERGSAFDSTGHPDKAVAFYKSALDTGLEGERRRRAVIQMSSSLRNAVGALAEYLPRYNRSMARYAQALVAE